jgi:hypothetical protein
MRWLVFALVLGCSHPYKPVEGAHLDAHAVAVGVVAPNATYTTASGTQVALADLLSTHDKTIVVFYRGFY